VRVKAGNLLGIPKRKGGLRAVIEARKKTRHLGADCLSGTVMLYAHDIALEAIIYAYKITCVIVYVN
jgi:hypothetical protein